MDLKGDNVIGIVGGMGPQAGTDLFNHISRLTHAAKDQCHRSVILMSLPKHLVDRTAFVDGEEQSNPAYNIAHIITKLESVGARVVGIACNSSHIPAIYNVILEELRQARSQVKLLHMPQETCRYLKNTYPDVKRVGVLATNGTYKSGLYQNYLREMLFEPIVPDFHFQDTVIHKMIYDARFGIKAHSAGISAEAQTLLDKALDFFKNQKAEAIILGCTELCLIMQEVFAKGMVVINSNESLAKALIEETKSDIEVSFSSGKFILQ